MRDSIFQQQEIEIYEYKGRIELLKDQVEELKWLNEENVQKLGEQIQKYNRKKEKTKEERWNAKIKYERMVEVYDEYISGLTK